MKKLNRFLTDTAYRFLFSFHWKIGRDKRLLSIEAVLPDVVDDVCGREKITLPSLNRFGFRESSTEAFGKTTNIFDHVIVRNSALSSGQSTCAQLLVNDESCQSNS